MSSTTKAHHVKKAHKTKSLGRARKRAMHKRGTTPSRAKLFGDAK